MQVNDAAFSACLSLLPESLRGAVQTASGTRSERWEEIRLRTGRGLSLADERGEQMISIPETVDERDLRAVLERATRASYQSAAEQLSRGFYTLKGGHRIGVSGAVYRNEQGKAAFRELSSLCIRIARPCPGIAHPLRRSLLEGSRFPSTLILAPPGAGKTTLLREVIRLLSDECGLRTAIADERGEVAALWHGAPQMDVGRRTDVLDGIPKAEGLLMLLRSMTPQVLAADEVTDPADVSALSAAANCGVSLLATAHGGSLEELKRRSVSRTLLEEHIFQRLILIERNADGSRHYRMEPFPC